MKYYLVIPARYKSKRLPGKPLMDICGVPMIIRTYNQCKKVIPESNLLGVILTFEYIPECKPIPENLISLLSVC